MVNSEGWRPAGGLLLASVAVVFLYQAAAAEIQPPRTNATPARPPGPAGAVTNAPPSVPLTVVSNLLATFVLRPGFHLELVAAEPMVVAPVAMAFDENGRLFVVERHDGPSRGDVGAQSGRIRLLDIPEGESAARTSTVFADNLPLASAVACYGGGIFAGAAPEIVYLKDFKGEGVAEVRQVVLNGFGGTNAPSSNAMLNNFYWGLDNRIHGATAGLGGSIVSSNWSASGAVSLDGSDFSFEPRLLQVRPEAGPFQSALVPDVRGQLLGSDYARPLRLAMYETRYSTRNAYFTRPPQLFDIINPNTPIFTFGAKLPARPGTAMFTNGLLPGLFSRVRGSVVYRGSAFPTNYYENIFIPDADAHIIHREVLHENGLGLTAARASEEGSTEFLVCKDPSFHPAQLINGPDGCLYLADSQDGAERGRIYRIVPARFSRPKPPQLEKSKTFDLVALLPSINAWQADTAARLLFERRDSAAIPLLSNMLFRSVLPLARLRALHVLDGVGGLRDVHILKALRDADERVREHGILLSERMGAGAATEEVWQQLKTMATDPSIHVRYQLAFTLGEAGRPDRAASLAEILARDRANEYMQNAVFSSLGDGAGTVFTILASDARFRNDPVGLEILRRLALMIGTRGKLDDANQVLNFVDRAQLDPVALFALLSSIGEGLHRAHSSLALLDTQGRLQRFYNQALDFVSRDSALESPRIDAVRILTLSTYNYLDVADWLLTLAAPGQSPRLRSAAIAALGRYTDPRVLVEFVNHWGSFDATLRTEAFLALMSRKERVPAVLAALEDGRIPAAGLSSTALNFLRSYGDATISARAVRLLGPIPGRHPEVMRQFQPTLKTKGRSEPGRQIFMARCAVCHQFAGGGRMFGPDLTLARTTPREQLLSKIIEPNAELSPAYSTTVVENADAEIFLSLVEEQNTATVTLRQLDGTRPVWPRLNIRELSAQPWSLMPDGLEQGLSTQDMADLLEYFAPGAR
jgi:putative membrane-bound dehydrogenase-like protein